MHRLPRTRRGGRRLAARAPVAALLSLGLLAPVGLAPAAAQVPDVDPYPGATAWIVAELEADDDVTASELADAIIAFAADGSAGDATAEAAAELEAVATSADDAATLAKVVLAANAAGLDSSSLGDTGFDAVAALLDEMETSGDHAGRFPHLGGTQLAVQSFAILALETTAAGAPSEAVAYLAGHACENGAFNFPGTCPTTDVDVTALAAQALHAAEVDASASIDFLLDVQADDGSFGVDGDPNANSTALAAQALRAAGHAPEADAAAAFVATLQKGCDAPTDRGAIATYPDADGSLWLATTQGVLAAAPALHELDASTASAAPSTLGCFTGEFCPTAAGVSVVVDFTDLAPDTDPIVRCVPELPEGATGLDVLVAAGFDIETQDFGGDLGEALCTIEGLPELPEGECFDPSYDFWSYWSAERGGDWTEYQVGAGSSTPAEGTVEGFAWASYPADPPRVTPPAIDEDPRPEPPYDRGITDACPDTYPRTFTDVAGNAHEAAIRCLAAADITRGTSDPSRFAPRTEVTRAQLASFLARSYEVATGDRLADGPSRFSDVGGVHARNIDALAAAGVIEGVGDGTRFAPTRTVTRAQMATLLARFLDLLDGGEVDGSFPPATDRDVFTDDDDSVHAVHEPAINRLAVQGVVQGRADGRYLPLAGVTRDQLATFLARSLDLAVDAELAQPVG